MAIAGALFASPTVSHSKPLIANLPAIESFTLPNGLTVAVMALESGAPVAAVQVWYHVGSKDEPAAQHGIAHLIDRTMWKGSAHVRADYHALSVAGLGGFINASTDEDATHYINTLPSDHVDYAIRLEAERMRNLLVRKASLETERAIIKDELRRLDASAITKGFHRFLAAAFTKHPYQAPPTGTPAGLEKITEADVQKFYDAYYQPNNAMLVVVGKVTAAQVKKSAEQWFGPIAKGAEPPRPAKDAQEPAQTEKRKLTGEPNNVGLVLVGYHIPQAKDPNIYALQVASIILGAGDGSRLKQRLEKPDPKTQIKLSVQAGMESVVREDPGLAVALGAYFDPASADKIETGIYEEVEKLGKLGPAADELRRAKNQIQAGFVFSLENAQGLAEAIGRSWVLTGNASMFLGDVDQIEKVTAADVQRVVKTYFAPDKATVVVIPPKPRAP